MSGFTPRTRPHSIIIPRDRLHAGIVLYSDLQTIETFGGGSARCMMAEIFLSKK